MNEVPTYQPPEGVHGPTLGRDLPDGCERCVAHFDPADDDNWSDDPSGMEPTFLYWWRFPPLRVGDPTPDGTRRVWTCKVGGTVANLPGGSDLPMRKAVAEAFTELTGQPVEFCFSGWGDDLDESELAVVEDRAPDPEVIRSALVERLEALPAAPPPAPPWPGAVLSGLVDEDGVPTWLAQAGQVRGEQVRHATTWPWRTLIDGLDPGGRGDHRGPRRGRGMTATSQGATNRRKGHETERMVVRWLRQVGWPDACTTRAKLGHDGWSAPGDVSFHPLIVLEVKNLTASAWPTWCRQAVAASAPGQVPCVVRRTRGVADVSQWRVRVRCYEWVFVLGQVPAFGEPSHDVEDANGEEWPWVEVSMDELANAVAAVDRSGDA